MQATRQAKDQWLANDCEIGPELRQLFPAERPIYIADIGACDGLSSIRYARMFPLATVLCFEPRMDNYSLLLDNLIEYDVAARVLPRMIALGDFDGEAEFHCSSGEAPGVTDWDTGNKSSSLLRPKDHLQEHPWCDFAKTIKVQVRRLDCVLCEMHAPAPEFIHLDVQGAELDVLHGATNTLKRTRAVWCEVANRELYEGQPTKQDVCRFMSIRGFRLEKDTCGNRVAGDCLFVRK